ncbi:MAG TPA: ferritin-like domain-containing protein [Gemmatimonadales bacterium]|nr:ferritin-like domain-containing protein [Gemmatimonadales bacterium]
MEKPANITTRLTNRRAFLKNGAVAAGTVTVGSRLLSGALPTFGLAPKKKLTKGDAAILRFLAAAEILESDLWLQYNELGGVQDDELPRGDGNEAYTGALENLDEDMPQYIHDNTEDEFTHFAFINAYLTSKGADPVDLEPFRTLQGSQASGARDVARLTNLMQLTVDTSWYTRYRSRANNPDLDPTFTFPQAVPSLNAGPHPAIPRDNDDLTPQGHIQAIANTAAFHFAFIEQGGTSLYPSLAQRVTSREVLRVLLSIGPTETAHFQTWHDKAGNAVNDPLAPLTDPKDPTLVFPNLNAPPKGGEDFGTSLIMPEPVPFLNRKFPVCSIIRPTETEGAAMGALKALTADGLFIGQSDEFFAVLRDLAAEADAARPEGH